MGDISSRDACERKRPFSVFTGKKVFIRSFGCALNQADGLRIKELIKEHEGILVTEDQAEVIVVNTCSVVKRTEREVLRYLCRHADRELFTMGCMATVQKQQIRSVCVSHFIPSSLLETSAVSLGIRLNEAIGLIPIARGCLGECTYCMARQARGVLRSEKVNEICRAVRILVDGRVREIQLTAQDMSSWGIDRRRTLPYLINKILSIRGQFRLRLGMLNPTTLIPQVDELLPCYQHKKMYAFAHIPVQSGSDSILAAMNRGYTAQDYMDLVRQMREHVPHMWITTDVIVGFPGETSDDFYQTLRLIEYIRPNKVNITRYSPRPGTDAAKLPDMLERDKKERSREMSRLADRLCNENNRPWIGKVVPVVAVEHIRPGSVVCRTPEYRSVIVKEDTSLGSTGYARITGARTHYLMGEMIK